ncbi:MAG: hypothetical protein LBS57_06875 [Treponema sp.]|jgi:hypothetical protein|nr:hypothetical protein [Treponema sp.]
MMKHPHRAARITCVFLLLSAAAYGQSAADMESILNAGEITVSQAAYVALAAALESPPENPAAAFDLAREKGWLPAKAERGSALTLGGLSLLVMKSFNLKGGLLYRIFPGGRYAYREMTSRGFIEGRSWPNLKVSGEQFLRILGKVLAEGEAE